MNKRKPRTIVAIAAAALLFAGCVKVEKECTFSHWRWPGKEGGEARMPRTISDQYLSIEELAALYDSLVHGDTVKLYTFVCTDTSVQYKPLFLADSKEYRYKYTVPGYFMTYKHLPLSMVRHSQYGNDSRNSPVCLRDLPDSVVSHADTAKCYVEGRIDFSDHGGCAEKMQLYISPDQIKTRL